MSEEKKMNVYEKLMNVQSELRAPKSNYNSFAKFNYRSLEDITEALKPILKKYNATVIMNDSVEIVNDRYYMKSVATFYDCDTGESISNSAYAREAQEKKGMDESQVSGMASSYCRKYCLNGLFLLDDNKDSDTDEVAKLAEKKNGRQVDKPVQPQTIGDDEKREIRDLVEAIKEKYPTKNFSFDQFFPEGIDKFTASEFGKAKAQLMGLLNKKAANNG